MQGSRYRDFRHLIQDGDNAMFRNGGIISRMSDSPFNYTHVGKCIWLRDVEGRKRILMLAEIREWYGGRIVTLSSQIKDYPGQIDIWRSLDTKEARRLAAEWQARMAGHPYGWDRIAVAFKKRLSLWRLLTGARFHQVGKDLSPFEEPKVCSGATCWTERKAARYLDTGYEPTVMHDRDCEPNHLANVAHMLMFASLEP